MAGWYNTGYEGVDREKERIARAGGPTRYWMKAQTTREMVFVDDEPLCIQEHSWQANGSWNNHCTCIREVSDYAPCCEKLGDKSRAYIGFYSIVDCTKNTDAKGNVYQYELKLLPAKLNTLSVIRRKKADRTSLVGALFKVTRDTADNPNCGNDYDFQKEGDLVKLFPLATYKNKKLTELYKEASEKPEVMARLKETFQLEIDPKTNLIVPKIFPFNYVTLLAPKEPKEIRAMLGSVTPDTGAKGANAAPSPKDDEIPF